MSSQAQHFENNYFLVYFVFNSNQKIHMYVQIWTQEVFKLQLIDNTLLPL